MIYVGGIVTATIFFFPNAHCLHTILVAKYLVILDCTVTWELFLI